MNNTIKLKSVSGLYKSSGKYSFGDSATVTGLNTDVSCVSGFTFFHFSRETKVSATCTSEPRVGHRSIADTRVG